MSAPYSQVPVAKRPPREAPERVVDKAETQLLMPEPTVLNWLEAELPRKAIATMQMTAMRATRRAYSTRLAPRSSVPTRAPRWVRRYCQVSMIAMSGGTSLIQGAVVEDFDPSGRLVEAYFSGSLGDYGGNGYCEGWMSTSAAPKI